MPTLAPCQQYIVSLNENKWPIPETMRSKLNSHKLDKGFQCYEAILPNTQMSTEGRCYPGFHWYYKVDKRSSTILPNSMWQTQNRIKNLCSGPYQILEYIVYADNNN